jgi:hypothetical protein
MFGGLAKQRTANAEEHGEENEESRLHVNWNIDVVEVLVSSAYLVNSD